VLMTIDFERLKEIVGDAYENGWAGCFELKEEYVNQVLERMLSAKEEFISSTITITSAPNDASFELQGISLSADYYSYVDHTGIDETVFVNEPGEEAL